jgi:hypothetical protein
MGNAIANGAENRTTKARRHEEGQRQGTADSADSADENNTSF